MAEQEEPLGRDQDPAGSCEKLPTAIELLRLTFGEFGIRSGNSSVSSGSRCRTSRLQLLPHELLGCEVALPRYAGSADLALALVADPLALHEEELLGLPAAHLAPRHPPTPQILHHSR